MRPRTFISQTMLLTDARLHNMFFVVCFAIATAAVYLQFGQSALCVRKDIARSLQKFLASL